MEDQLSEFVAMKGFDATTIDGFCDAFNPVDATSLFSPCLFADNSEPIFILSRR